MYITSCNSMASSPTVIIPLNLEWSFGVKGLPYRLTLLQVPVTWRRKRSHAPNVIHRFKSVSSYCENFRPLVYVNPWSYWIDLMSANGQGYLQQKFSAPCTAPSCSVEVITKEKLAVW